MLAIDFEGVLVAFGTLQANAKKQLADHRRDLFWFSSIPKDGHSTISPSASLGSQ